MKKFLNIQKDRKGNLIDLNYHAKITGGILIGDKEVTRNKTMLFHIKYSNIIESQPDISFRKFHVFRSVAYELVFISIRNKQCNRCGRIGHKPGFLEVKPKSQRTNGQQNLLSSVTKLQPGVVHTNPQANTVNCNFVDITLHRQKRPYTLIPSIWQKLGQSKLRKVNFKPISVFDIEFKLLGAIASKVSWDNESIVATVYVAEMDSNA